METDRLLRISEVAKICGLSAVTIWRLRKTGAFPAPLQVGPRAVRWRESALREWIESRPAANSPEAA